MCLLVHCHVPNNFVQVYHILWVGSCVRRLLERHCEPKQHIAISQRWKENRRRQDVTRQEVERRETLCARLRSQSACQDFTRATSYRNLKETCNRPKPRPTLGASLRSRNVCQDFTRATLYRNLQEKCRGPDWGPWSSTGLYTYRKNPSVWTHCLGKNLAQNFCSLNRNHENRITVTAGASISLTQMGKQITMPLPSVSAYQRLRWSLSCNERPLMTEGNFG